VKTPPLLIVPISGEHVQLNDSFEQTNKLSSAYALTVIFLFSFGERARLLTVAYNSSTLLVTFTST